MSCIATSVGQATYHGDVAAFLLPSCTITVGSTAATGHLTVKAASLLLLYIRVLLHLILLVHGAEQHINILHGWDVGSLLVNNGAAEQGVDLHLGWPCCKHLIFITRQHLQQSQQYESWRAPSCKPCWCCLSVEHRQNGAC